ncbi:MAG: DUF5054 domain-containing protein [bacterium]
MKNEGLALIRKAKPAVAPALARLFVVHKTHLDVGFTDLAETVVRQYVEDFVPAATRMALELNSPGQPKRFVWTLSSWLLCEALERLRGSDRRQLDKAILSGGVTWHALPFTAHSEYLGETLYRHCLSFSAALDKRYGHKTIAAKVTDVPGHSRGIVRILWEEGVRFLHVGVNSSSMPPEVPPMFVWRDSGGREVVVAYSPRYGGLNTFPEAGVGLHVAHTNDNTGPPTLADCTALHADLSARHPGTVVEAAPLDAFAKAAWEHRARLRVVTAEIGDTWIHGTGTDPAKTREFMALRRLAGDWLLAGKNTRQGLDGFLSNLCLVGEHTWGMNTIFDLPGDANYQRDDFARTRAEGRYARFERSWAEQREYTRRAVDTLSDAGMRKQAETAISAAQPSRPDTRNLDPVRPGQLVRLGRFIVSVDVRGALARLVDAHTGASWATPERPMGLFLCQTFSRADYQRFWERYAVNKIETRIWSYPAFIKVAQPEDCPSGEWASRMVSAGLRRTGGDSGDELMVTMRPEGVARNRYGAPAELVAVYRACGDDRILHIDLQWFDKPACRMPEACWMSFVPDVGPRAAWTFFKLGEPVSPRAVVRHGNRVLHAVDDRVECVDGNRSIVIRSLDTPLVAAGHRRLLDFSQQLPVPADGVHFNLFNNLWETNFPLWFGEDARFRFTVTLCGQAE